MMDIETFNENKELKMSNDNLHLTLNNDKRNTLCYDE